MHVAGTIMPWKFLHALVVARTIEEAKVYVNLELGFGGVTRPRCMPPVFN